MGWGFGGRLCATFKAKVRIDILALFKTPNAELLTVLSSAR